MSNSTVRVRGKVAKVLIVDDHPVVREGLALRINAQKHLSVCGEAEDVASALRLVRELQPDVAIVDISLTGADGIELIKHIRSTNHTMRILVASMYDESVYAERALRAGANGYINKREATRNLVTAINRVLEGKLYLNDDVADRLVRQAVNPAPRTDGSAVDALTDRELETLKLIGAGQTTALIAKTLCLSPKTIETYRERIRRKLDIKSGAELMHFAVKWVLEHA